MLIRGCIREAHTLLHDKSSLKLKLNILRNSSFRRQFTEQKHKSITTQLLNPQFTASKENFCFRQCTFFTLPGITGKKKEYIGKKVVGFSMDQMFEVVSDVSNYRHFVPFCIKSIVTQRDNHMLTGELEVGFPPIVESYSSRVTFRRPHTVRAECYDGKIFNHLTTTWKFDHGIKNCPQSCTINFYLSFEFKSVVHSQLANIFFDQLVKQMEAAFVKEAERRFGKPSIPSIKLK